MSFKSLVCAVSEQRQEIKQAIALFPYFDSSDANAVTECCRVSSLLEVPPDEIILGPGTGDSHMVHFLLDGICKMVQHLQIKLSTNPREKYKLHILTDSRAPHFEKKEEHYLSKLFNQKQSPKDKSNEMSECSPATNQKSDGVKSNDDSRSQEEVCVNEKEMEELTLEKEKSGESKAECSPVKDETESKKKILFEPDHHLKVLEECKKKRADTVCVPERRTESDRPANVRSLFIETGNLFAGAIFGLGKLGKENFIMSLTAVKILKIPLRFLLQHNPCNIWNRISLFYSLHLFGDEKIFEHFQNARKWTEKKKNLTREIVSLKNIPNYTSISDVPYWIRLSSTR